jgi:hypothetical protein
LLYKAKQLWEIFEKLSPLVRGKQIGAQRLSYGWLKIFQKLEVLFREIL